VLAVAAVFDKLNQRAEKNRNYFATKANLIRRKTGSQKKLAA